VCRLARGFAFAPLRFFLHNRHARAVHLHIENGNRFPDDDRQIQLHGLANLALLTGGNSGAHGLCRALYRLGSYLQSGQRFHLLATALKSGLLTDRSLHAAHAGRELRIFDVQFDIGRELAVVAVRAQVVGTRYFHRAHSGQNRLGAQLPVLSRLTTRTGNAPLLFRGNAELQQLCQRGGTGLMQRRAHRHLDGLQVQ